MDRCQEALGKFQLAIRREETGLVACAVRVEEGVVVDFSLWHDDMLPEQWQRLMKEPPREVSIPTFDIPMELEDD